MDACIPEKPLTQCHRCLRRHSATELTTAKPNRELGLRAVVIDGSAALIDGRCQFKVDCVSLGQAELGGDARPFLRETREVWPS